MSKNNLRFALLLIAFCFIAIIGLVLSYRSGLREGRAEIENKYQEKIAEIYPYQNEPEEILFVSGRIKEVKNRSLILEETVYPRNPFEEISIKEWEVVVVDATVVVKTVEREGQSGDFIENMPTVLTEQQEIQLAELSVGQTILVQAVENIKNKIEFEAQKIILQEF